jgi:hypothetical protein
MASNAKSDRSDPDRTKVDNLNELLSNPKGLGVSHIAQVNRFAAD